MNEGMQKHEGPAKSAAPQEAAAPIDMEALEEKFSVSPEKTGRRILDANDTRTIEEKMVAYHGEERTREMFSQPAPQEKHRVPHSFLVTPETPDPAFSEVEPAPRKPHSFLETPAEAAGEANTAESGAFDARKALMDAIKKAEAAGYSENEGALQALRDIRNDESLSPEERKKRANDTGAAFDAYMDALTERNLGPR